MRSRKTTEEFIADAQRVHELRYDYSSVEYTTGHNKVIIICRKHGQFSQQAHSHLSGRGCPTCNLNIRDNNQFKIRGTEIHGNKYDYSKVEYTNNHTKVCIICPEHGEFWQTWDSHINQKKGCKGCSDNLYPTTNDFIKRAIAVHENKYDYSKTTYVSCGKKVIIICPVHGDFNKSPSNHINKSQGCPRCRSSKGETVIRKYLESKQISFKSHHWFEDCRNKNPLPFDFFLPEMNILIEFDGLQHTKPVKRFGGEVGFKSVQHNDNIKNKYASDNGIKLMRIPYSKLKYINEILDAEFNQL